jgi:iron complex outermembrane receptor protein
MKVVSNIAGARPRFGALSSAIAMALAGLSSASLVQAQEQQAADESPLEEITVTGSRIVRQDFTANSPVQTVDQQMFEQTSSVSVETILNRLPQFVPAVTQFSTGDVQQTATNTVGASTVSLRGLGPNRNLVLINGRRAMPIDPRMVVDTNSIPSTAIQRVEIISGGASAVYGADAVGGVVNFILKDNYEGASVDVRFADTEHGGDQNVTMSALIGANTADDRGNVMIGIERATRAKAYAYQRDWRLADFANPRTAGGAFAFGSATWWHNEPVANARPNPNFNPAGPTSGPNAAFNARLIPSNHAANPLYNPALPISATNATTVANNPDQARVNAIFNPASSACPNPNTFVTNGQGCFISNNLLTSRFSMNRDGTIFGGLAAPAGMTPGAYRFNGPVANRPGGRTGDLDGDFQGYPVFVQQTNGAIKENVLYNWTSIPLEQLSGFANGHFDVSDNVRLTGQAMVTRTKTETNLGLAAANINQWGAGIPFGDEIYHGNSNVYFDIPDSIRPDGTTDPAYLPGGKYGLNCEAAPTPQTPWATTAPGCTMSEAWPISPEVYTLMNSRPNNDEQLWASREPDWMRSALGAGRSTNNVTQTMSFTLGVEGDLPSGDHSWDVSLYTGRSDNTVNQLGSMRLTSYRDVLSSPNFGKNATFDSNPWEAGGFAESIPTCTSGLPIADEREVSADCLSMISPALKNVREMTQTILEANLVGDLAEMRNGPLSYALGFAYRENSFGQLERHQQRGRSDRGPVPERAQLRRVRRQRNLRRAADPDHRGRPDGRRAFQRRARRPRLGLEHGADAQPQHLQGVDRLGHHAALSNPRRLQPRVPRAELGRALHPAHAGVRRLRVARLVLDGSVGSGRLQRDGRGRGRGLGSAGRANARDLRAIDGLARRGVLLRPGPAAGHRRRYRRLEHVRQPELARGAGRYRDVGCRHGRPRGLPADGRLVADRAREHDLGRKLRRHLPGLPGLGVQPDRRHQ